MAQLHTITRDEAARRRAMLDITSYDLTLDLTTGEETFLSQTVVRFTSRGGDTFLDVQPRELRSVSLDGAAARRAVLGPGPGAAAHHAGRARAGRRRRHGVPQRRRGDAPGRRPGRRSPLRLRHVVHGGRAEHLRVLRPAGPEGAVHPPRHRTRGLAGGRQRACGAGVARAVGAGHDAAAVDVLRHARRRPLPPGDHRARRDPAGPGGAGVARAPPGRPGRRDPRHHPAELRRVPPALRHQVRVRRLPPGLRPRVQRRRHGESGLRDLTGPLGLHLAGHAQPAHHPRHHDRARDGAPVVRQHRHAAVVGRPLAQRVVRGVHGQPRHRRRDRVLRRVGADGVRAQDLGPGHRPVAGDAPGRGQRRSRRA